MNNSEYVFKKVSRILEESYDVSDVHIDSILSNGEKGLDLDSFEIVSLIIEIEKEFDIVIDFDVLFITVEDIVEEICRIIEEKKTVLNEG